MIGALKREMRKLFDGVKVEDGELADIIVNEVLKRDVVDGDAANEAKLALKKVVQGNARRAAREAKAEINVGAG